MAEKAHYVGEWRTPITSLNLAHGANGVVVIARPRPAAKQNAAGEWIDGTRVRSSRIHGLAASGIVGTQKLINLLRAYQATKAGGLAIGSATTITRSDVGGDFLADGWQPGQRCALLDTRFALDDGGMSDSLANRRLALITGVAAQTLTFGASTFATGLPPLNANVGLYRLAGLTGAAAINPNSGNAAAAPAVSLLTPTAFPWAAVKPDTAFMLDATSVILAQMTAGSTLSAGETIDFLSELGDH